MNNIIVTKKALLNEIHQILMERDDYRVAWETFDEYERNMAHKIVNEILRGQEKEHWNLIPFPRLKRIWEQFMQYKFIRDEKGMEMIKEICVTNIARLYVNTVLVGHTQEYPRQYLESHGYCFLSEKKEEPEFQDPNQLKLFHIEPKEKEESDDDCYGDTELDYTWEEFEEKIDNYIGDATFSDFALQPLVELAYVLIEADSPEEQLMICDRIFNVVHMRGDIAALFVQGGSDALSQLSGEHAEAQVYRPM